MSTTLNGADLAAAATEAPLLSVSGLSVEFPGSDRWVRVVSDVTFDMAPSSTLGLVGESGSGKTVTSLAVLGLTSAQGGRIPAGSVKLAGEELVGRSERELSTIRGNRIGMIFQQPIRSLDPAFTVGDQIAESVRRHRGLSRKAAWKRAVEMLDRVQIHDAARRAGDYPHQLSGGMCQRVMIAIALSCEPDLLVADEPTTALDVTVQAKILELMRELQRETGVGILFISHDLGVIAEVCERVLVMYAGQVVEDSSVNDIFVSPTHPYTEGLLGAIPKPGQLRRYTAIPGSVPANGQFPQGCRFHPRCAYAAPGQCDSAQIELTVTGSGAARCARVHELSLQGVLVP